MSGRGSSGSRRIAQELDREPVEPKPLRLEELVRVVTVELSLRVRP
jgi:hypothetical protein